MACRSECMQTRSTRGDLPACALAPVRMPVHQALFWVGASYDAVAVWLACLAWQLQPVIVWQRTHAIASHNIVWSIRGAYNCHRCNIWLRNAASLTEGLGPPATLVPCVPNARSRSRAPPFLKLAKWAFKHHMHCSVQHRSKAAGDHSWQHLKAAAPPGLQPTSATRHNTALRPPHPP